VKATVIGSVVMLAVAAAFAGGGSVPYDVGCANPGELAKLNDCRAQCKKTSDATRQKCIDATRDCHKACKDEACRDGCMGTLRKCEEGYRNGEKTCRQDCYKGTSCKHIDGTPGD
jgi:hypothetical protein